MAIAVELRGVPLELHPRPDWLTEAITTSGDFFEAAILDELARRITGGVLVDAGAMIGNHTAYLAAFVPHAAIHAFEPEPANLALLHRNVDRYPGVEVHPVALSDRGRTMWLHRDDPQNMGHTEVVDEQADGARRVRALPLDAYQLEAVRLLKLDVEGHEPEVLAGAAATLARCHPLVLLEDWHLTTGALLPAGYRLERAWPDQQTYLWAWQD